MTHTHSPLTTPVFLVLTALAAEDRHGYSIMQAVEQTTGGEVVLSAGTLYGVIKRLVTDGWIEETRGSALSRRRTYRLTEAGRAALTSEAERLSRMVDLARAQNLLSDPA